MNEVIAALLYPLGVTANYRGFFYTACAIEVAESDPAHLTMVTKDLYPTVATRCGSTTSRVERNIRLSANLAWRTNPALLQEMAGYPMHQPPCASHFIAILTARYKKLLTQQASSEQMRFL